MFNYLHDFNLADLGYFSQVFSHFVQLQQQVYAYICYCFCFILKKKYYKFVLLLLFLIQLYLVYNSRVNILNFLFIDSHCFLVFFNSCHFYSVYINFTFKFVSKVETYLHFQCILVQQLCFSNLFGFSLKLNGCQAFKLIQTSLNILLILRLTMANLV